MLVKRIKRKALLKCLNEHLRNQRENQPWYRPLDTYVRGARIRGKAGHTMPAGIVKDQIVPPANISI